METTKKCPSGPKSHVHEILGSTKTFSSCGEICHNHRFATMSEEAIPREGSHVHKVKFTTDTFDDHEHEFYGTTSKAIDVGDGRHVHFIEDCTRIADGHSHQFRAATLIDNPIECR